MRLSILMLCLFLIGGCAKHNTSFFKDRNKEYLAARSIPPLRMPPGVSSETFTDEYPISNRGYPEGYKDISLTPPGL